MDTNTLYGLSFAQEQAAYLEDFSKNPQKYYDDHEKAAERLRINRKAEAVSMAPAPRRGLFQDDSALRSLCGPSRTLPRGEDAHEINPASHSASMQHNQTGLPRRDQTVYLQPQEPVIDTEPVIQDQTSDKARSPVRYPTMSYAQPDHGALSQHLNTTLKIKNNTPSSPSPAPAPLIAQTPLLHTPRAHIRDSTLSYVRHDYGSLQQSLGTTLAIAQDLPDIFGARDDWSGDDSDVYDRSLQEQYGGFSSRKQKAQLYENHRAKAQAKIKGLKKWVERKFT
ncbi:hypothetical protein BDU57DRAFT_530042 [Ampelomyces quisqualis]|uniref:Uncharacterized protein n=1 Tax=Ampelomyces quisqualis TaxID=50730 RepID=A0A6A5QQK0_AMPQU|nr:hypothetical protein BDU57DRAFT_530042 [Ampelomyces quisqualis]